MPDPDDFDFRRDRDEESRWSAADHQPGETAARLAREEAIRKAAIEDWAQFHFLPRVELGTVPELRPDLGPCWVWTGSKSDGYGRVWLNNRCVGAHRVGFALGNRRFPAPGNHTDHLCRNHSCVRPGHLEEVDPGENQRRGLLGFGLRTLCRAGLHDITDPANVMERNGGRRCRPCHVDGLRRAKATYEAKPHACPQCGKPMNVTSIPRHVRRVHEGRKDVCACGAEVAEGSLQRHLDRGLTDRCGLAESHTTTTTKGRAA